MISKDQVAFGAASVVATLKAVSECLQRTPLCWHCPYYQYSIPVPDQKNKELDRRDVDTRDFRAQRYKTPESGVLAHRLPFLANPGADGDQALVWDISQDQQQHLVRQLLHVAGHLVLVPHAVSENIF